MHEQEVSEAEDASQIVQAFEKSWNSPDREFIARIEVLRYGWWNCVIQNQKSWLNENQYHAEFKKLMSSITSNCH